MKLIRWTILKKIKCPYDFITMALVDIYVYCSIKDEILNSSRILLTFTDTLLLHRFNFAIYCSHESARIYLGHELFGLKP